MDPYEILGISRNATEVEIKRKYHELAKKHHPDKLAHLSATERAEHEETFKKITAAYEYLRYPRNNAPDWASIWNHIAKAWAQKRQSPHEIHYEIPIEDIIAEKTRKIRIFLNGQKTPIYLNVKALDVFKNEQIQFIRRIDGIDHKINLNLKIKEHPDFWFDSIDKPELYTYTQINWYEYLVGCRRNIQIPGQDLRIDAEIPPFSLGPIHLKTFNNFNLYMVLELLPPSIEILTKEEISGDSKDYEEFKNFLHKWSERALST